MYLSKIKIQNFRNFSSLEVELAGNVVVVGENRVGKSNLLYALRLLIDPGLPDSARQLALSDFWDGMPLGGDREIVIEAEIKDFDADLDILALLTDYRLDDDAETVRLTYKFRPQAGLDHEPASEDDYEFICFGGEDESKAFGHSLRRRLTMEVFPALRDAEGDLGNWRRSPLRPLVEGAMSSIDASDLDDIGDAIARATAAILEFDEVKELEEKIGAHFLQMSGERQDINPRLGFSPTESSRLHRNIRLLIDEGRRGIADASLGSANLVFLTLKALELQRQIDENSRDHIFLAIEEPEAHLHPHLQRSVYRHLFARVGENRDDRRQPLSIFLTTHSPHIASVAPLRSILLLKEMAGETDGFSAAGIPLENTEVDDLARYLDVTRAEMLFARGVILVEGDAERFLLPVFAQTKSQNLDHLGISVCSVSGTNFKPYVKFLTGLNIPFAVITDWDPMGVQALGEARAKALVLTIQGVRDEEEVDELEEELNDADEDELRAKAEEYGIFINSNTLEIDLFNSGFDDQIIAVLREAHTGRQRRARIDSWAADPATLDVERYMRYIDTIGKGRFAQRLAALSAGVEPPDYIGAAIDFVCERV